jgi:hypothetical protein
LEEVGIRVIPKLRSNAQPTLAVNFALELDSDQVTNVVREIQQATGGSGVDRENQDRSEVMRTFRDRSSKSSLRYEQCG